MNICSFPQDKLVYESHRPSLDWPTKGVVEFKNYSLRYRPGLDLVLKDINAEVQSGEKVGYIWVKQPDYYMNNSLESI